MPLPEAESVFPRVMQNWKKNAIFKRSYHRPERVKDLVNHGRTRTKLECKGCGEMFSPPTKKSGHYRTCKQLKEYLRDGGEEEEESDESEESEEEESDIEFGERPKGKGDTELQAEKAEREVKRNLFSDPFWVRRRKNKKGPHRYVRIVTRCLRCKKVYSASNGNPLHRC